MIVQSRNSQNKIILFYLFIALLFITCIRWRLLDIPLERDEGEYAYMGQLLLKGYPPFSQAYNMKYPGTSFIYAIFITVFGNTIFAIHFGLALVNIFNCILVFKIVKKVLGQTEGLITSTIFGILALSQPFLGFAAHATHFVLLFALPGFYYLLKAFDQNDNRLFFFAGLLMGVSFIMKQSGIFFILLSVIILLTFFLRKIINFKKITLFGNGILFPILTLILILLISGTFDKFWFWTYTYLTEYGTKITFSKGIENLSRELTSYFDTFPILIILFILGILFIVLSKNVTNYEKLNFLGFILFSFLTVVPGLYFRGHYFITFLPAFAFGISFLYHELKNHNKLFKHTHKVVGILVILGSAQLIYNQKSYLFQQSVNEISRNIYGINPFIESLPIAKYIQKNSSPTDKIAILGSEPQIYYYSDRLSATGYIYTYNLMEPHRYARQMQDEMIKEIENNNPKFIIYTTIPTSWLLNEKSNTYIFDWLLPHLSKYYAKVGIIEFTSQNEVKFAWDSEIDNFIATSRTQIQVFKRINQGIF